MSKQILKQPLITSNYFQASQSVVIGNPGGDYTSANGIVFSDGTIQTTAGTSPASTGSFATTGSNIFRGNQTITGSLQVSGGITGSLFGTASWAQSASNAINAQTASYVLQAVSASFASNGGVTQLLAGPNITLSPTNGLGQVTITSTGGGGGTGNTATGSYGSFYDTTTQTNPVGNVPRSMSFNTTAITNGVSISGSTNPFNTYIKTENAGLYNLQFSAQLDKTDSGADEIVIWLRKNGIDLIDTATTVTLAGNNAKNVAAWNFFVNSAANDYYQLIWYSSDTSVRLLAEVAGGGHPGIPSVIATANRIDQFLSNTGSFTGSFTGNLIGTATTASYISGSVFTSTNPALSASYALTASYVLPSPSAGLVYYMTTNPASLTVSGGVEQTLASITIPANTVQVGDRLEIFYSFNKVGTNATAAYRVRISGSGIDGTLLNNGAAQGATVLGLTTQNLYRVLSTSSMVGSSQFFGGVATVGIGVNYTGSSLTGSNTFYFNAIRNSAVDTITLNDCYIKIIR